MRLKASIWVKAYIRTCAGGGLPVAVVRHGDDDAGTIFVRVNLLNGTSRLFGPAPAGLELPGSDRLLAPVFDGTARADDDVDRHLQREAEFDSDLWVVEVESRDGRHFLDDWLAPRASS